MGRTKTLAVSTPATTIIETETIIKIVVNIGEEKPGTFIRAEKSDDTVVFYFHKRGISPAAPNHVVDFP